LKRLKREHLLEELVATPIGSPFFWLSEYGLQSHGNRYVSEGILNFVRFLVELGAKSELTSVWEPVLDPENIEESTSLECVLKEFDEFCAHYRSEEDPQVEGSLHKLGLFYYKVAAPVDEEAESILQELMKSKGGKRGQLQMMDESEASLQQIRKHKQQFVHYYNIILQYLGCTLHQLDAKEWFMYKYFDRLSRITVLNDTRHAFQKMALPFLRSYSITEAYANELVELLIDRAQDLGYLQ
jgi:hypothetical protein